MTRLAALACLCSAVLVSGMSLCPAFGQAQMSVPPLIAAASGNDLDLVRRLIREQAQLDARDGSGRTALLIAVAEDRVEIARLLIEAGADINAQADNQDTPWLLAGARGRTAILSMMLDTGRVDYSKRNRYGGNALIPACHYGHVDTVRLLLDRSKIDIDHVNYLGWTALLEAIILGDGGSTHAEIVRMLVAAGANVNLADRESVTPLGHARRRGFAAIASVLVSAGAR